MPVWRDDSVIPNVVIVAETPITEQGTVEDALLFVLDETPECVQLTDQNGVTHTFHLPEGALAGDYTGSGLDLQTENLYD